MGIQAGRLRHRIDIQTPTETQNPTTGEITVTWANLHTGIAAAIEPLSAREFMQSKAEQSEITARIVIRRLDGLTAKMRIVHNGNIYNPEGFLPDIDSGLDYLTIPVKRGVNTG